MSGYDHRGYGKFLISVLALLAELNLFYGDFKWVSLVLGLFLCWRLWKIHSFKFTMLTICLLILFMGRCSMVTTMMQHQPQFRDKVRIRPDQLKLSGSKLNGVIQTENQPVFVSFNLTKKEQNDILKQSKTPICLKIRHAKIRKITPATNYHVFDFSKWSGHRGIAWQLNADVQECEAIPISSWRDYVSSYRCRLKQYFNCFPKYTSFHLRSLLLGVNQADDFEIRELLSAMGLIHLFALSGLHVDFLIRYLRTLAAYLHIPDEWVRAGLFIVLPFYCYFVGAQIGVIRAVVTYLIRQICQYLHVSIARLDLFGIVLIICLWLQPACLLELGPQLSFALTLTIKIMPVGLVHWRRQLRLCYLSLLIISFHTFEINVWTILMGLIILPILTPILLPCTMLNVFVPISCRLTEFCWQLFYHSLAWLYQQFDLRLIIGSQPICIFTGCLILFFLFVEQVTWGHRKRMILLLPLICVGLGHRVPLVNRVTIIDVGQGDSILIQTSFPRKTILIDTGGLQNFSNNSWTQAIKTNRIKQVTLPYLYSQGIDRLDLVLLSHQDADHIGDLGELLAQIPVGLIGFSEGMQNNPQVQHQLSASKHDNKYLPLLANQKIKIGNNLIQIVAPIKPGLGTNEDSLTALIVIDDFKWLFTGDLDQKNELALIKRQPELRADFLKVGHHGSKTASHPRFIQTIQPRMAFISAGRNNRYHHPNPETCTTLDTQEVTFLNTAQYGMIEWIEKPWTNDWYLRTRLTGSEGIDGQDYQGN